MKRLINQSSQHVVCPVGRIDASNATKFQEQLQEALLTDSPATLVVDMSQVDFLDSAGLMALLSTRTLAQSRGVGMILDSIPGSVQIMLELTQLDRVFPTVLPGSAQLAVPQAG